MRWLDRTIYVEVININMKTVNPLQEIFSVSAMSDEFENDFEDEFDDDVGDEYGEVEDDEDS